ncbi:hypothetical protein EPO44_18760 [bacterium]|nr:MAG: hypothetical protein EPO44_18760 [bacterium]
MDSETWGLVARHFAPNALSNILGSVSKHEERPWAEKVISVFFLDLGGRFPKVLVHTMQCIRVWLVWIPGKDIQQYSQHPLWGSLVSIYFITLEITQGL